MKILLIAEHDNVQLKQVTQHVAAGCSLLNGEIDLLIIGEACDTVAKQAQHLSSVTRVRVAEHPEYKHQLAENTAKLIAELAVDYDYIITGATTFGKNILPRAAALLDTALVSDVIHIVSHDTFVRPIYAGNALATVQNQEKIKFLTLRGTAFPAAPFDQHHEAVIEPVSLIFTNELSTFEHQQLTVSERPELTSARIIISGGRGLKSAENFKLLEALADQLGAAIGASRAAVDAGFAPNDYQVGQTGKVVAPDLYFAVGISGAIQHLAGMKDSKVIVAINSDPDAPIFQIADYGLVGDLFTILPELQASLSK